MNVLKALYDLAVCEFLDIGDLWVEPFRHKQLFPPALYSYYLLTASHNSLNSVHIVDSLALEPPQFARSPTDNHGLLCANECVPLALCDFEYRMTHFEKVAQTEYRGQRESIVKQMLDRIRVELIDSQGSI